MKKWLLTLVSVMMVLVVAACGNNNAGNSSTGSDSNGSDAKQETVTLTVGASAVPHGEILNFIKPQLEEQGVKLDIKEYTDYVQPNVQLFDKQLDANFFQHQPYLDSENSKRNMDLVGVAAIHVEPFGAYSKRYTSVDEIPDGATIAIPNDATNAGRALILLDKNGLIKLADNTVIESKLSDITENSKNFKFIELEAAVMPRQLEELDLALINTNYALEAGLVPTEDALFIEDKESPYSNLLVARPDNKDNEAIQKLVAALTTDEVKKFIEDTYKGAVVPAF